MKKIKTNNFTNLEEIIKENTEVKLYWNLHKDCYSILAKQTGKWKVIAYTRYPFLLKNVEFIVNENGRQRVIREKKKYVHAYLKGNIKYITGSELGSFHLDNEEITYNPYTDKSFRLRKSSAMPVLNSDYALCYVKAKDDKIKPFIVI